jgi:hypothetical protein
MKDVNLSFKVSKGVTNPFPLAGRVLLLAYIFRVLLQLLMNQGREKFDE